jgi:dihydroorotate dehydrogenase (NAD+) catalytic subunit
MIDLAPHNPYGLRLRAPVLAAAGCFGYGVEYAHSIERMRVGAIVTRSTSLAPRRQRQPRLLETPAGLLISGGWHNPGIEFVLAKHAPVWAGWDTPVILSLVGANAEEYATLAGALEGVEGVAGVELNLADTPPEQAARITAAARRATQLPILAKLPQGAATERLCAEVAAAGADALTLFAPPRATAADASGALVVGWLAGPAIRPLVLAGIAEMAASVGVPAVACGGVASAEDARQMLAAGAVAVQVGSALLAAPELLGQISAALAAEA